MKIYNLARGQLGNAFFRLFASICFCITYDGDLIPQFVHVHIPGAIIVDENFFKYWSDERLKGRILNIDKDRDYIFTDFYQHDQIYMHLKNDILSFINNRNDIILSTHFFENYPIRQFWINETMEKKYDVVFHIRLGDHIDIHQCIHPKYLRDIIDSFDLQNKQACIVVDKVKTELENEYVRFINVKKIPIESNDPVKDFLLMKNAKVLVCSFSTLSWCAAILSTTLEKLFVPDYSIFDHRTFLRPIRDTRLYPMEFIHKDKLEGLLFSKI